jgi:Effector Associated Constant Component 1
MSNQLQLSVTAGSATDEEIAGMTRELAEWIGEAAPGCEVKQQTETGPEGAKGIIEVLGTLGVSFLEHGALSELVKCLAVYIKERRREVSISLKTASGQSVELKAGGIGPREIDNVLAQLGKMIASDEKAQVPAQVRSP